MTGTDLQRIHEFDEEISLLEYRFMLFANTLSRDTDHPIWVIWRHLDEAKDAMTDYCKQLPDEIS